MYSYTLQSGTIMTLILPNDCTLQSSNAARALESWQRILQMAASSLQYGRWLWDDMPLNSPKCPPYWNSMYLVSISTKSQQLTCHSAPVSDIGVNFLQIVGGSRPFPSPSLPFPPFPSPLSPPLSSPPFPSPPFPFPLLRSRPPKSS